MEKDVLHAGAELAALPRRKGQLRKCSSRSCPGCKPVIEYDQRMDEEPIRIPVTDVFDLHSVPDRDVRDMVEAYLEEAHELGFRYVRLIHGRGIGVRRETVRTLLARCEFVESFGDAPGEAGGWGATV